MKAKQKRQKVDKGVKTVEKKGTPPPEGGGRGPAGHSRYISFEMRRKAVKLYLEEGIPSKLVAQEIGIKASTLFAWVKRYREQGEEGLRTTYHPERCRKSNGALTALQTKIVEVKHANPRFGVKRISQVLRRIFFVPASAETVRRTLHKTQLMPVVKKKPQSNPSKPRFFERSTPNQMWQSDIFPFHLSGQMAYLIGFIDDHSRYIVSLGLYRSQTAENVLEVYRCGTGEYRDYSHGKLLVMDKSVHRRTWPFAATALLAFVILWMPAMGILIKLFGEKSPLDPVGLCVLVLSLAIWIASVVTGIRMMKMEELPSGGKTETQVRTG